MEIGDHITDCVCVCMYGNFPFKSECVHVFVAK